MDDVPKKKRGAYKPGGKPSMSNLQKRKEQAKWRKDKGIQGL